MFVSWCLVCGWGASECVGVRKGVGVGCNRTCVSRGRWKDKWNNMRLIRQGRTANLSMCVCVSVCVSVCHIKKKGVRIKSCTIVR